MTKTLRAVRSAVLGVLLAILCGVLVILMPWPRATGEVPLTVLSGSMRPTIKPGSVVVRPVDASTLRIGDVITYQIRPGDPTLVTHRIVSSSAGGSETTFRTTGDANDVPDPDPIRAVQFRGKFGYQVPFVGYVTILLDISQRGWIVKTIAVGLIAWATWLAAGAAKHPSTSRRAPPSRNGVHPNV